MSDGPLLLPVRLAHKEAGIGRDHMYRLINSGEIRAVSVGRKRLVPRKELDRWIERELAKRGDPT